MVEHAPALWTLAGREPDDVAVDDGRATRDFAALERRTNAIGHGIEALGLRQGDHVALVAGNRCEFLDVLLGVQRAGMVVTPVKTTWTAEEIAYVLRDASTRLVVTDQPAARDAAAGDGVPVLDLDEGFESWLHSQDPSPLPHDRAGWRMSFTSGTTGRPKGVARTAAPAPFPDAFAAAATLAEVAHLPGDGPHLVVSPLFHGAPLAFALGALARGATLRVLEHWDEQDVLRALAAGAASTCMVPTMFRRLLVLPDDVRRGFRAPGLRTVLHGGEPCPVELKRRMIEWWGPRFVEYFGASEGGMTVATTAEWEARPGTVGRAMPGQRIVVLGDDGDELSPRAVGRVFFESLRGGRLFSYLGDDGKTDAAHVGNAFTAGDIGWMDEDGYVFLSGRSADVIVSAGVNVYPAMVEAVIQSVDGVVDACVVGAPDEERGEQPVAFVVLAPGAPPNSLERIDEACAARLAGYERPRALFTRPALPRDPTGKLLRRELRDELWADQDAGSGR